MSISQEIPVYTGVVPNKDTQTTSEFEAAADSQVEYLDSIADPINTWADEANSTKTTINGYKTDAQNAQTAAESAKDTAVSNANATIYASGTTYSAGDVVLDPGHNYISYTSQQDSNTGNTPNTDDGTWWALTLSSDAVGLGTETISTSSPSGGSDGDKWYQVS